MRNEQEIRDILTACEEVAGFGMSYGPCPLKINDPKDCLEGCPYTETDKDECCANFDLHRGCCAECSFPSALRWVLGGDDKGSDNGQNRLMNAF